MLAIPVKVLELLLQLIILMLEGVHPNQRAATALAWFWMWWPLMRRAIKDKEAQQQVEALVRSIGPPPQEQAS